MNRNTMVVTAGVVLVVGGLSAACRQRSVSSGRPAAAAQLDHASIHLLDSLGARIVGSQRVPLRKRIVHYTYDVALGTRRYEVIRLHRVVEERGPGRPSDGEDAVFLLPGAPNRFGQIFMEPLISPAVPWDQSVAIFLAKNNVDVWGMDYGWALVPAEETDFSFMEDWGLAREIRDAEKGLAVARLIRASTGQGNDQLQLLGFSYGVHVGYAVAADETQQPPNRRNVRGIIPVDAGFKTNEEAGRVSSCRSVAHQQGLLDAGVYQDSVGLLLQHIANLARTAPDSLSPLDSTVSNFRYLLRAGAGDDGHGHFIGGVFDASGSPTGARFTDPRLWLDLAAATPPYLPVRVWLDLAGVGCNETDVPFDDHLGEITIPIFFVGAAGGFGSSGTYTTTLTASRDVTTLLVQLLPGEERAHDFGHADLFTAGNAEEYVWRPILNWIKAHRMDRNASHAGGR